MNLSSGLLTFLHVGMVHISLLAVLYLVYSPSCIWAWCMSLCLLCCIWFTRLPAYEHGACLSACCVVSGLLTFLHMGMVHVLLLAVLYLVYSPSCIWAWCMSFCLLCCIWFTHLPAYGHGACPSACCVVSGSLTFLHKSMVHVSLLAVLYLVYSPSCIWAWCMSLCLLCCIWFTHLPAYEHGACPSACCVVSGLLTFLHMGMVHVLLLAVLYLVHSPSCIWAWCMSFCLLCCIWFTHLPAYGHGACLSACCVVSGNFWFTHLPAYGHGACLSACCVVSGLPAFLHMSMVHVSLLAVLYLVYSPSCI